MQYFVMEPHILIATLALLGPPLGHEVAKGTWLNNDTERTAIVELKRCTNANAVKHNVLHRHWSAHEQLVGETNKSSQAGRC